MLDLKETETGQDKRREHCQTTRILQGRNRLIKLPSLQTYATLQDIKSRTVSTEAKGQALEQGTNANHGHRGRDPIHRPEGKRCSPKGCSPESKRLLPGLEI